MTINGRIFGLPGQERFLNQECDVQGESRYESARRPGSSVDRATPS